MNCPTLDQVALAESERKSPFSAYPIKLFFHWNCVHTSGTLGVDIHEKGISRSGLQARSAKVSVPSLARYGQSVRVLGRYRECGVSLCMGPLALQVGRVFSNRAPRATQTMTI